jgi:hypothetical protein
MDEETKKYLKIRAELEKLALESLEKIKTKVQELPSDKDQRLADIQRLTNVVDELDDVLYNWNPSIIKSIYFDDEDLDDFDD